LRAAFRWCLAHNDVATGARLAGALHQFWYRRGHFTEGLQWTEALLALPDTSARSQAAPGYCTCVVSC
jgi:predicted ATPase